MKPISKLLNLLKSYFSLFILFKNLTPFEFYFNSKRNKKETLKIWETNIASNLTDKLQQTVFVSRRLDINISKFQI